MKFLSPHSRRCLPCCQIIIQHGISQIGIVVVAEMYPIVVFVVLDLPAKPKPFYNFTRTSRY